MLHSFCLIPVIQMIISYVCCIQKMWLGGETEFQKCRRGKGLYNVLTFQKSVLDALMCSLTAVLVVAMSFHSSVVAGSNELTAPPHTVRSPQKSIKGHNKSCPKHSFVMVRILCCLVQRCFQCSQHLNGDEQPWGGVFLPACA